MTVRVLVVDDDFRVADLHARYVAGVGGFSVVGRARSGAEALAMAEELRPDLVLLDNYLPDVPGLSIAARLQCDVIVVTADASATTVRAAFAAGALNFVVKPFPAHLLESRLAAYHRYRQVLSEGTEDIGQAGVDRALAALRSADRTATPKGQSPVTARLVAERLQTSGTAVTAAEVASALGISRATAQRYLASLADTGQAAMTLRYGSTGRPEHRYEWVTSGRF